MITVSQSFTTYVDAEVVLRVEKMGVSIQRILDEVEEYLRNDIEEVGYIQEYHTAFTPTINGQQITIGYEFIDGVVYIN